MQNNEHVLTAVLRGHLPMAVTIPALAFFFRMLVMEYLLSPVDRFMNSGSPVHVGSFIYSTQWIYHQSHQTWRIQHLDLIPSSNGIRLVHILTGSQDRIRCMLSHSDRRTSSTKRSRIRGELLSWYADRVTWQGISDRLQFARCMSLRLKDYERAV